MKHTGPAPFGFTWKSGTLVIVEKEAEVRKLAFELYAELQSKAAVANRLNEAGHQTRRGGKWRDVTVSRLLNCSSARGLYAINKTEADDAGAPSEHPGDAQQFVECPPIVSLELWERVQGVMRSQAAQSSLSPPGSHPFAGVLFCQCGGRMHLTSTSQKFACAECGARIPVQDLEDRFLDEVTSFLKARQDLAAEFVSDDRSSVEHRQMLHEAELKAQRLDAEISSAERLIMENRISVQRFEKVYRPLEGERQKLQRELRGIRAKLTRLETKKTPDKAGSSFQPDALQKRWPTLPTNAQRHIVRSFVSRVVVAHDEIEFTYPFRDFSESAARAQHSPRPTSSLKGGAQEEGEPVYIRLPKPGQLCERTRMTRSALNELILPTERNGHRPPVESKSLRKREGGRGTRLIVWQSLKEYLASRP